jgi:hypothetical protein
MPHHLLTHEDQDRALLYALGLLEAEERHALQKHIHDGCGTCESEVKSFETVVKELSYCASPWPPPSRLRQRLLDQVSNQLTSSLELSPDNVDATIETLFSTSDRPFMTALIRLTPSTNPGLAGLHAQEIYVIQGQARLNGLPVSAGDYLNTESEPLSGTLRSQTGCLLLAHS